MVKPIAGTLVLEIVQVIFRPYREIETSYRDLKRLFLGFEQFDVPQWESALKDVYALVCKHLLLLPDDMQVRLSSSMSALQSVLQLWRTYRSLRDVVADATLPGSDKPGLLWSIIEKNESIAELIPDSIKATIEHTLDWQKRFNLYYLELQRFQAGITDIDASAGGELILRKANANVAFSNCVSKLPGPLQNYLAVPPALGQSEQAYIQKLQGLRTRFDNIAAVSGIHDVLTRIETLASEGLFEADVREAASFTASTSQIFSEMDQWLVDFDDVLKALAGLFTAKSKSEALQGVQAIISKPCMTTFLGARLTESLNVCMSVLCNIGDLLDDGRSLYARLESICRKDEPLLKKLGAIKTLIDCETQLPRDFKESIVDVVPTLGKVSSSLAAVSLNPDAHVIGNLNEAFIALLNLVQSEPMGYVLGPETIQKIVLLIDPVRRGLLTAGQFIHIVETGQGFEDYLKGILKMLGSESVLEQVMGPVFKSVSGLSYLTTLAPWAGKLASAESMAERLSILAALLADQDVAARVAQDLPAQYSEPLRAASRLFRSMSVLPASDSEQNRLAALRQHILNPDAWRTLIDSTIMDQWSKLVFPNDAVLERLRLFLPLINSPCFSVNDIYSVVSARGVVQAAQHGLSGLLYHVSDERLHGVGAVASATLGCAADLMSDDPATCQRVREMLTRALESTLREVGVRYIRVANPTAALVTDAFYNILLKPAVEKCIEGGAASLASGDAETKRVIAEVILDTLRSACPSKAEFLARVKKYFRSSPAMAAYVKFGAYIVDELSSHVWTVHLTFDLFLLMHAESADQAQRAKSLAQTLMEMDRLGHAWVRPYMQLIPFIPDLLAARMHIGRNLPDAESWLEWGAELSAILADNNDPSVIRLRRSVADYVASLLTDGFRRLSGQEESDGHPKDAPPKRVPLGPPRSKLRSLVDLTEKAADVAAISIKTYAPSALQMRNLLKGRNPAPPVVQKDVLLSEWDSEGSFAHIGIKLLDDEKRVIVGTSNNDIEVFEKPSGRFILVASRAYKICRDTAQDVYRLLKPGSSSAVYIAANPAVVHRDGQWFVSLAPPGGAGAGGDEEFITNEISAESAKRFSTVDTDDAEDEQDASIQDLWSLLGRIRSGTEPEKDVDCPRDLENFQMTADMYQMFLQRAGGGQTASFGGVSIFTVAGVLGALGVAGLLFYGVTGQTPYSRVPTRETVTGSADSTAETDDISTEPDVEQGLAAGTPRIKIRRRRLQTVSRVSLWMGVSLIAGGALIAFVPWLRSRLQQPRNEPSNEDENEALNLSSSADAPHVIESRAVTNVGEKTKGRSKLEERLRNETAYAVVGPSVALPLNIDTQLGRYSNGAHYVDIAGRQWKIDQLRGHAPADPLVGDPLIRFRGTLQLVSGGGIAVVYQEKLGWQYLQQWKNKVYAEATPETPSDYVEHDVAAAKGKHRSHLFLELLANAHPGPEPIPSDLFRRKSGALPQRLFQSREGSGEKYFIWVRESTYLPIVWWRVDGHKPKPKMRKIQAAGIVRYWQDDGESEHSMLLVYDNTRDWTPAYFLGGEVNIFGSSVSFRRMSSRYDATVRPDALPAKHGMVDRIARFKFAAEQAHKPSSATGMTATAQTDVYSDATGAFYYKCESGYWQLDWNEVSRPPSVFAAPDVTHHGYIRYQQSGAEARLHVLYSDKLGLVPSMLDCDGKVTSMTEETGTAHWAPTESLMKLVRSFEKAGALNYAERADGQPGRLYYDYLESSEKLYMYLDHSFWAFEWIGVGRGLLHAAWADGTPCDVVIAVYHDTWSLGWDAESAPRWFEAYMKLVLTKGELGLLLSQTTESSLAHHPLDNAKAIVKRMASALSVCEKQYRQEKKNEEWISVIVLSAQLIAFFSARSSADGILDLGLSDEIYKILGRIYPSRLIEDQIDVSIINEIMEGDTVPENSLERIKKELNLVDVEMAYLTAETAKTQALQKQAKDMLDHRQGSVSPDYESKSPAEKFVEDIGVGFQRLLDAFSRTADAMHIVEWAGRYVTWLTKRHKELDDRRNALTERRELIRMPERYVETFKAYVAGLETGKKYEEKYRVVLSNIRAARESKMESALLHAIYAGALAELATRRGSLPGFSMSGGELAAAQYYLLNQLRAQSRLYLLIDKLGNKLKKTQYTVTRTYCDILRCLESAIAIERATDNADLDFVNADTAILAAIIFQINTNGKSITEVEQLSYAQLLREFKEKARLFHPYAVFPKKPENYKFMFELLPSSLMGEDNSRYTKNDEQFENYKKTSLPYDCGTVIRNALESAQIDFDNFYNIREIIGLDFPELSVRIHYIKLADNSWLYFAFVRGSTSEKVEALQTEDNAATILRGLSTKMIWIKGDPGACGKETENSKKVENSEDVENSKDTSCDQILTFLSHFFNLAAKRTKTSESDPKCFFGKVTTYLGIGKDKEHQWLWNLEADNDAASRNKVPETELLRYLFNETRRDMNELIDQFKTSMFELHLTDKVIGFFVPFYSEIRKQQLDENYSIDPMSIMLDSVSLALTVIPSAHSMSLTVKAIASKPLWQFGKNSGWRGRFVVSHAVSQSGKKALWSLGKEFFNLTYHIFNPLSFPFNPLTLDFARLTKKGLVPVATRSLADIFSDVHLVKGFLDKMFLPINLNTMQPSSPLNHLPLDQVGPGLFCQTTSTSLQPKTRTFYIKSGNAVQRVVLNQEYNYFALQQSNDGLLQALRRRYSDWVGDTVPVPVGSVVEPDRVGTELWNKPERVQRLLRNLRAAESEATMVLKLALRVMKKESYAEKTKQSFDLAWGESTESALKSFELNAQNMLDYLESVSLITDIAYLGESQGNLLSAMPGSAFDIRRVSDIQSTVWREDIEEGYSQYAETITGPGFLLEGNTWKEGKYMARQTIIPLVMRDDDFDPMEYERFGTAYLVRLNHITRCLIREAFVATTSSKRVERTWETLMKTFRAQLEREKLADKRTFFSRLSRTYGIFLHEDKPVFAKTTKTFMDKLADSLNPSGHEIGIDVSPLLEPVHRPASASLEGFMPPVSAPSSEAVRDAVANPDNFSLLVYLLSDIHADPDRFSAFTYSFKVWKSLPQTRKLYWRWFE